MNFFYIAVIVAVVASCSTQSKVKLVSSNPDWLVIGEVPPAGFPKEHVESKGDFCVFIREAWRKDTFKGQTIWFKDVHRISGDCTNVKLNTPDT